MRGDEVAALVVDSSMMSSLPRPDPGRPVFGSDEAEASVCLADLVAMPGVPHPIPFRTRPLSPPGPMVLCPKARESRSPPGPPDRRPSIFHVMARYSPGQVTRYVSPTLHFDRSPRLAAGWSSPVARQAHNLKVAGSNPAPAPKSGPSS